MKRMNRPRLLVRRGFVGAIAISMVAAAFTLGSATAASASPTPVIYNATPTPLPPNVASVGFEATQTAQFGDHIVLGDTARTLQAVTVTMSDWALYSDYSGDPRYSADSTNWTHPITVNIYSTHLDPNGVPDMLLGTITQTVTIPWRPVADPTCSNGTAWRAGDGNCYNGLSFNATFDMSGLNVTLPNEVIVGIAYNTADYGTAPIGSAGPYNSLNVGVPTSDAVTVGSDANTDNVFWNTSTPGNYTDGGTAGVGIFREDTNWTPYGTVAITITAGPSLGACPVSVTGANPTVYTLLANCTTDQTITVPQNTGGSVFNGNGFSITGVDPTGGHFLGAVVQAAPGAAPVTVQNLTVTVSNLTDACDAGANRLRGILFDGVGGSIINNHVTDIEQGTTGQSGCQEGNAIEARYFPTASSPRFNVTITGNTVTDYQKTGIVANGTVAAIILNNVVTGDGPVSYIATNGIQVGFGATAVVKSNSSSGNSYTPTSDIACGFLIYQAGGVNASSNNFFNNERNQCNFGKGGGTFKPSSP